MREKIYIPRKTFLFLTWYSNKETDKLDVSQKL